MSLFPLHGSLVQTGEAASEGGSPDDFTVRFERDAIGAVMLDERSGGFTNQSGEDALIGVLPDAVAAGQEQTAPSHLDMSDAVNVRSEFGDPPGPGARVDSSHDVQPYVRERAIGVRRSSAVLHRYFQDPI
jgi:hypothetical protein